jgi:DNA mismatch repair protein MSH5
MDSVYLALCPAAQYLALAHYHASLGVIYAAQTPVLTLDFAFVEVVLHELGPEVVLCPSSAPDELKRLLSGFNVTYCSKAEFSYEKCKEIVLALYNGKAFYAKSKLDISCPALVGAIGAVLSYLMRSPELLDEVAIHDIQTVQLGGLIVDLAVLRSLHIFVEESHPSKIKGAGRSKEGFSVFGLIDRTLTAQGRRLLRQWMLRPLNDSEAINERLDSVQFLVEHPSLTAFLAKQLQGSVDLVRTVGRFASFRETCSDWSGLTSTLLKLVTMRQALKNLSFKLPRVLETVVELADLSDFLSVLSSIVDTTAGLHIAEGVSKELEYWRKTFDDLQRFLVQLAQEELQDLSRLGVQCGEVRIVHIAKYGFLLEVHHSAIELASEDAKRVQNLQYKLIFQTPNTTYFQSPRTQELDSHFGDLNSKIVDTEAALLRQVEEQVLEKGAELCRAANALAELDALISLALAAGELGLSRPVMKSECGVSIVNGRHLLVQRVVQNFIPNDCLLGGSHKVGLITGPNCSGKSIYLKMVGTIVLLAHVGSFVPAESAEIGLVDGIFARLTNPQLSGTSSFELELLQLSRCLAASSERSLVLLDEFGKTTCSEDCIALLVALLRQFDRRSAPLALVTTHYTEIVSLGLVKESEVVQFYAMEMAPLAEPVFLYKLIRGVARHSLGFSCAKLAGLPQDLLQRAGDVRACLREGREVEALEQSSYLSRAKEALKLLRKFDPDTDDIEVFFAAVRESVLL